MEPTARVPSGDAVMAARSRGTLRRAASDAGRYHALVRLAEAALVMETATEGRSVEVAAMTWVEPEDQRSAVAKRRRRPRRRRWAGGGGGYPNPNLI
jgi:hypothetical protein